MPYITNTVHELLKENYLLQAYGADDDKKLNIPGEVKMVKYFNLDNLNF